MGKISNKIILIIVKFLKKYRKDLKLTNQITNKFQRLVKKIMIKKVKFFRIITIILFTSKMDTVLVKNLPASYR
jgi:hypothetical protein